MNWIDRPIEKRRGPHLKYHSDAERKAARAEQYALNLERAKLARDR